MPAYREVHQPDRGREDFSPERAAILDMRKEIALHRFMAAMRETITKLSPKHARTAVRLALGYADEVITEGGFGFDLGGEKFLDIKCRAAGIWPRAVWRR